MKLFFKGLFFFGAICSALPSPLFCADSAKPNFEIPDQYCPDMPLKLEASVSGLPQESEPAFAWSFGDGKTASTQKTEHHYARSGDYEIALTVKDSKNSENPSLTVRKTIHIDAPPEAMLTKVAPVCVRRRGNKISFDASASFDPEGHPLIYSWDFGDGSTGGNRKKIKHRYAKAGMYKVVVTVDDGSGSPCAVQKDKIYVKINTPPEMKVEVPQMCPVNQPAVFDASASSDPDGDTLSYYWGFGDGENSTDSKASHTFTHKGKHKVFFAMDDNAGTECGGLWKKFKVSVS